MEDIKLGFSMDEVCSALGVSRPIVERYIKRRDNPLPSIKAGRRYIIPKAALEMWILEEAKRDSGKAAKG